jgi:hypothetical protein
MMHACAHYNVILKARQNKKRTSGVLCYPSHVSTTMKKIVGLLMFKWVNLDIWRKLFLAPRNLQIVSRNLWHVESNYASLFASTLFFLVQFFQKEILKIEIESFFRALMARSEKIA